jgi:hypothetical protein
MPRFSVAASLVGWATASFVTSLLVGLALVTLDTGLAAFAMGVSFAAIFAGFLAGGYAAGRIGPDHGALHGAVLFGWTALFTALGAGLSLWTHDRSFAQMLSPFSIRWDALDPRAAAGLALVALVMLAGAALGAALGSGRLARGIRFGKFKPARTS